MNSTGANRSSLSESGSLALRRSWPLFALLFLLFGTIVATASDDGALVKESIPESRQSEEENLLINPSFEGDYHPYFPPGGHPDCPLGICQTAQMADGWTPWWQAHNPADDPWIFRMPEYKAADLFVPPPPRVRSGDRAQQYFTFHSTHKAGIYQRVPVQAGQQYCFTVWGHSWSSTDDNPFTSDNPLFQRVGIDPSGGTSWQSGTIVWSSLREQYNEYGFFYVCAVAQADYLTVFTFSEPVWAAKHNDVYWDDAELKLFEPELEIPLRDGIYFLADVDNPRQMSVQVRINVPDDPWVSWHAELLSGGTIVPTLSTGGGIAGEHLTLTVNSTGLQVGTYNANLKITGSPNLIGSPAIIPITVKILDDFQVNSIPYLVKP